MRRNTKIRKKSGRQIFFLTTAPYGKNRSSDGRQNGRGPVAGGCRRSKNPADRPPEPIGERSSEKKGGFLRA
jgi:hypothetical protein